MVFASDDLVYALIGNAEHAGEFGLGFARFKAGNYNLGAFTSGKRGIRRLWKCVDTFEDAGNG